MRKGRLAVFLSGIEREYQHDISVGIQEEAANRGYATYFFCCQGSMDNPVPTSDEAEANIFRLPELSSFDGAIVLRATIANPIALKVLNEQLETAPDLPMVFIDERISGKIGVGFEDAHCVQNITEHFITKHGAQRLCFVSGPVSNTVSIARQREFEQTLCDYNLPFNEDQLFCGGFIREGGAKAAEYFMHEGAVKPDAIICANDDMALGLCEALMNYGLRIPDDIGVAGFDSIIEASVIVPTLTTVKRPVRKAGMEAVRLLDEKLNGEETPEWTALKNEIIFGQSCGCGKIDDIQRDKCIRRLNRQNNNTFMEYARANSLAKRLSGIRDFDDFRSRLADISLKYINEFLYVAVVDGYAEDNAKDKNVHGYASDMRLLFGRDGERIIDDCVFSAKELLPSGCVPQSAVICPIHADGHSLGYVATPLMLTGHFTVYTVLSAFGNTLENMRLHARIRKYAEELENLYIHDKLTGLLNRQGFAKYAVKMYDEAVNNKSEFMIICADMDSLKFINDNFGHNEGDSAIIALAECIRQAASVNDLLIHLSGDEFMIISAKCNEQYQKSFILRIRESIDNYNAVSGKPYRMSASFGGCIAVPDESMPLENMMRIADDEMYIEKKNKKVNRC